MMSSNRCWAMEIVREGDSSNLWMWWMRGGGFYNFITWIYSQLLYTANLYIMQNDAKCCKISKMDTFYKLFIMFIMFISSQIKRMF